MTTTMDEIQRVVLQAFVRDFEEIFEDRGSTPWTKERFAEVQRFVRRCRPILEIDGKSVAYDMFNAVAPRIGGEGEGGDQRPLSAQDRKELLTLFGWSYGRYRKVKSILGDTTPQNYADFTKFTTLCDELVEFQFWSKSRVLFFFFVSVSSFPPVYAVVNPPLEWSSDNCARNEGYWHKGQAIRNWNHHHCLFVRVHFDFWRVLSSSPSKSVSCWPIRLDIFEIFIVHECSSCHAYGDIRIHEGHSLCCCPSYHFTTTTVSEVTQQHYILAFSNVQYVLCCSVYICILLRLVERDTQCVMVQIFSWRFWSIGQS